ncbi:Ger(x)C family spore germination protein [Cytobacillus sp. NCCP-133]|uniref:Ger(x)C family spore germination protein n=1 Tax=Cytobacillus sp. NCCP-133 TaxID=766848 RepID=UPI00222FC6E9|nr:Ger(x)C family spore germination protein [Cytobacillus sp. NCCP-133]GLB60177.1 germination protein [Cytobacillus sp. NCCP-133]
MGKLKRMMQILLLSVLLTGCMNIDQRILDDVQLVTGAAYRYVDDDIIELTTVFPNYQPDGSVKNETLTTTAILNKENRDKQSLQSEKPMVSGKLEVALYERETAEKGIVDLLDTLARDPSIGANIYLAILDGNPKVVLSKQYGNMDNGIFLSNLIEQNVETGLIHKTNLHIFKYKLYAEGIDPMLPIIEQKEGKLNIKAIGLFEDDKLVDQIEQEKFFFLTLLLVHKGQKDTYAFKTKEEKKVSIVNIKSVRKYDIPEPMTNAEIKINMDVKAIIREYSDGTLNKQKIKKIENELKDEIEKNSEEIIQQFQEKGIDPLGIGEEVRTRTRKWDQKKWKQLYPDIKITVRAKVKIMETGVIE